MAQFDDDTEECLLEVGNKSTKFRRRICPVSFRLFLKLSVFCLLFVIAAIYILSQAKSFGVTIPSALSSIYKTPPFKRHKNTEHLDCGRIMENDQEYIKQESSRRVAHVVDPNWPMSCRDIKARNYFPATPLSKEEQEFPIAFARAVYEDYNFLETELAAIYQPQNYYCYAIDKKASETFHNRIKSIASCFGNVYVTAHEWSMWGGHNMTFSHLECMDVLTKNGQKWKYLVLQQNYDVATKTNEELVQIYKWMQGANDVQIRNTKPERINHVNKSWTFEALKLFKNETRNLVQYNSRPAELDFAEGYVQSSLSREMVDFIVNDLNVTKMILQLEDSTFAVDEIFTQTLQATDALEAPGGFTHSCLDRGMAVHHWSRFHLWGVAGCHSKLQYHYLCVFGIEDLVPYFNNTNHLFHYKMVSTMDFGAIDCWHETLYNRTHFERGTHRLDSSAYLNHPLVRFQVEKKKNGVVDLSKFDCSTGNAPFLP
ncbi:core-2/I-Branching enzyme domain-containing protein [Ditylenchus destructor]|uniref:Core-2/I-Branching enzyme domain-containing protein n=1 Tax=Ditylenchus destructor TaxID=166010 RepID=A0AAD4R003_9BILA|nr:core-2/I-Branching enzyme domain-containing protein [Ditylenchus destructor]